MLNHKDVENMRTVMDQMIEKKRMQDGVEAFLVYMLYKHGKDVGNQRKELVLTKAMMDEFDPQSLLGFGVYFERNETTKTLDLRCVCGPKLQLEEEASLNAAEARGSA